MPSDPLTQRGVRRMARRLALTWALTWAAGIALLATVAIQLASAARTSELDGELSYYATAVYAMGWFDRQGRFRDRELLDQEDLVDCPHGIWVLEPEDPPRVHWEPTDPRVQAGALLDLARESMRVEDQVARDVNGFRALALPVYQLGAEEIARGAVVVVADQGPGLDLQRTQVRRILFVGGAIGLVGIALGLLLAARSTRPLGALLAQRERFLTAAAHELKTPLAIFRSVHDSVAAGDLSPAEGWRELSVELERATEGVEALLVHARLDAGVLHPTPSAVRLDLLLETLIEEADDVELEAHPSVVQADAELVAVAIRNLLRNARRHGGPGPVRVIVEQGRVEVLTRGAGFPEEVHAADPSGRGFVVSPTGSGFGLAVARLVAVLHGGSLELTNREEGGTSSVLRLPTENVS